MGNITCNLKLRQPSSNFSEKSQFCIEYKTQNYLTSLEQQKTINEEEEIDQCSPFSKFDIKFLNSSASASFSSHKKILGFQRRTSKIQNIFTQLTITNLKNQKIIRNWSKPMIQNQIIVAHQNTEQNQKNNIIQINQNVDKQAISPLQFQNVKISGEIFCKIRNQPISPYYQIKQKIGEGSFGSVYKGKCLKTDEIRAIKILKKKIMNKKDEMSLLSQINILKKMDHINIVKLYDVFNFNNFFYVVTEFCEGGSLLQALQDNLIRCQKEVSKIMKQILSAVCYMHKMKIAHRDLKLQNIVLVKHMQKSDNLNEKAYIKIIDFGLASEVKYLLRNKSGIVGTLNYMAPQIFDGYYSCHSDIWSCGIIMCVLLIGYNPFYKSNKQSTISAIKQEQINFNKRQWSKISCLGKKLLAQMLHKKPQKRISLQLALQSQFLKNQIDNSQVKYKSELVINNFNNFNKRNNFVSYVKNFLISKELSQNTRHEMAQIFQKIDSDGSGVIQKHQLIQLYSLVTGATETQIQKIIQKIDQNKSGQIDFQQFLICMTQNQMMVNHKYLNQAFEYLDKDHTGFIEKTQLCQCLQGCLEQQLLKILKDADFDGDGKISQNQFLRYLCNLSI